jgi:phosphatidylserine/phosphatidylglycerophosphate/cardiolipin synthase-like enzyme
VQGPAATDVHHNFVQRWNGASERHLPLGAWPAPEYVGDLEFPQWPSERAGEVTAQLTRTIRRGFYHDDTPTPGGFSFPVKEGEASAFKQYLLAIEAAREAIYLENQFFISPEVLERIEAALQRGVEVVVVVPGVPSNLVREARRAPTLAVTFARLAGLSQSKRFTLAGLAASRGNGVYDEIYVHSKAAIVDDVWATVGSTNIANRSFFGDTELNVSFWHHESVRSFRSNLLSAHLTVDTSHLEFTAALITFRKQAEENRHRREKRAPLVGFAYALDPKTWGFSLEDRRR